MSNASRYSQGYLEARTRVKEVNFMYFLVNPNKIIVEVDEYSLFNELLEKRGFREATDNEIINFKENNLHTADSNVETDSELKDWILLALNNSTSIEKLERVKKLLIKVK